MFDLFRSRDKMVRFFLGALLVIVALSMLTYLIPSYNTGGDTSQMVVARIGKDDLTMPELQRYMQAYFRGRQVPPDMIPHLVPTLVQDILTEYALAYEARRMGMQVSDTDLGKAIQMVLPALFQGGQFAGKDAYAAMLAQQNLTIPEFEHNLRRQMLATRLRDIVLEGTVVTPADIEQEYRRKNEKVRIEYVKLTAAQFRSQVQVTPEEARAYFQSHAANYQIPERRDLAILIVDQAKIEQSLTPSDADLERMYNQDKERFRTPERVKVRHILLKTTGKTPQEETAIKAKAEGLLKQIKSGGNFAELAKKNSEDTGSAAKGGELGDWVVRGQTVPEFEKEAFTLKPGETSGLVKTQYGYHILQVLAKEQAHLQTFAEAKTQLASEWRKQRLNDVLQRTVDQAEALLRKTPPEQVAAQLNLELVRAENVAPGGSLPQVGANPDFEQAVLSLARGEVSQAVSLPSNRIAVAQVTAVHPAHPATFEEVQNQVRDALLKDKAERMVADRTTELYQKVNSMGGDLKKAAQSMGLEVKTSEPFDRAGAVEGLGTASMVADAFVKPVGSIVGPTVIPDARIISKVIERKEPDMAALAAQREALRDEVKARLARERNVLFEDGLRQTLIKEGKIKIYQDVVNRLQANYRG
ncbi:MAG: peptidylprolyl isomerase [Bryobacteraceae bacterium]